jgi:phospholipase C
MSTQRSCQISIQSLIGDSAIITLWHKNSDYGVTSQTWEVPADGTCGPMTVLFNTGLGSLTVQDYWAVKVVVQGGSAQGVFHSVGSGNWTECQLQSPDAGQSIVFKVDTSSLQITLPSGGTSAQMQLTSPLAQVDNVFVLMLENHSFDNIFALSGIPGIVGSSTQNMNEYNGVQYFCAAPAPTAMPTDPGHEFADTYEQLCGEGAVHSPWSSYGSPTATGFVANYATSLSELKDHNPAYLPTPNEYGDIMLCFDTPNQLPVIYQLATEFAVCDRWWSSLPGPTWPNRFFVHGASSAGWADSPGDTDIAKWETVSGFTYPSGASIYDRLGDARMNWRIYVDEDGDALGGIPQVSSLKGITYKIDTESFSGFAGDLLGPYPYPYTFIEPNYGDISGGTYVGGSSQHPMDSMAKGEALIKATYEAIRASPGWERSLLIVTYDEHGGFHDAIPPYGAPPPNDGSPQDLSINSGGFLFDQYGVRVPAVIVSPLIPQASVSHTQYDHASVAATLEALWGLPHMTARDQHANTVLPLLSLGSARTDCPLTLNSPAPEALAAAVTPAPMTAEVAAQPLPASGNTIGFLHIMAKTDLALANGDPAAGAAIQARVAAIKTRGEAAAYFAEVSAKAAAARAAIDAAKTSAATAATSKPLEPA